MKIILVGSTGFIGGEVLRQALASPRVTEAVVLARRPIPDSSIAAHPKLRTLLHRDFAQYPSETLQQLRGAEACIWALGDVRNFDAAYQLRTRRDWPFAAAEAFVNNNAAALPPGRRFRFVLTSGQLTERDQDAKLWFLSSLRKLGGKIEEDFLALPEKKKLPALEPYVARPGAVLAVPRTWANSLAALASQSIGVDELAAAMLSVALDGSDLSTLQHNDLVRVGREGLGNRGK